MNAKDKITKARTTLCMKRPFYAYLALMLDIREDKRLPTMGVDARGRLRYNPDFVETLTDKETEAVLVHECMHVGLLHLLRLKGRDREKANIACFLPNEPLLLDTGESTRICDAKKGQGVVGIDGNYTRIRKTYTRQYHGNTYTIKARGLLPITSTEEHPFLTMEKNRKGYPIRLTPFPIWKEARHLIGQKDYLLIPKIKHDDDIRKLPLSRFIRNRNHVEKTIKKAGYSLSLTADVAWLLGMYVANGSKSRHDGGVSISLGNHKRKAITKTRRILTANYRNTWIGKNTGKSLSVICNSTILGKAFAEWCGQGAHNKHIPSWILHNCDNAIRQAFLDGYLAGDGCRYRRKDGNDVWLAATANNALALQLQLLIVSLGSFATLRQHRQRERKINGRKLPRTMIYELAWYRFAGTTRRLNGKTISSTNQQWKDVGDFIAVPIISITRRKYDGRVHNIETDNHTYCAKNAVTHNCDLVINAMLSQDGLTLPKMALLPKITTKMDGKGWTFSLGKLTIENIETKTWEAIYNELPEQPPQGSWQGQPRLDEHGFAEGGGDGKDSKDDGKEGGDGGNMTAAEMAEAEEKWKNAMAEAATYAQRRGSLPAGMERMVEKLLRPRCDWRAILRKELLKTSPSDISWRRPHKKSMAIGTYLPAVHEETRGKAVITVDTSGSVSPKLLEQFVSEIAGFAKAHPTVTMTILSMDAEVQSEARVRNGDVGAILAAAAKMKGGGGTSHVPAIAMIAEKHKDADIVVHLTDGMTDFGECPAWLAKRTTWCISEDIKAPYGKTIRLEAED